MWAEDRLGDVALKKGHLQHRVKIALKTQKDEHTRPEEVQEDTTLVTKQGKYKVLFEGSFKILGYVNPTSKSHESLEERMQKAHTARRDARIYSRNVPWRKNCKRMAEVDSAFTILV